MLAQEINGRGHLKGHANTSSPDNTSFHFRGTWGDFQLLTLSKPRLTGPRGSWYKLLNKVTFSWYWCEHKSSWRDHGSDVVLWLKDLDFATVMPLSKTLNLKIRVDLVKSVKWKLPAFKKIKNKKKNLIVQSAKCTWGNKVSVYFSTVHYKK